MLRILSEVVNQMLMLRQVVLLLLRSDQLIAFQVLLQLLKFEKVCDRLQLGSLFAVGLSGSRRSCFLVLGFLVLDFNVLLFDRLWLIDFNLLRDFNLRFGKGNSITERF